MVKDTVNKSFKDSLKSKTRCYSDEVINSKYLRNMKRLPPNMLWMGSEGGDKNSSDNIEEVKYDPFGNW